MYKAVFLDMDGTLLTSHHVVSEPTRNSIRKLREKSVLVCLVSARPLHGILHYAQDLGLMDTPIISLNGSYISMHGEIIFQSPVAADHASQIQEILSTEPASIIHYQQMEWFSDKLDKFVEKEQKITRIPIQIQDFPKTLRYWKELKTGPNKILIVGSKEWISQKQTETRLAFGNELNICTSKPIYLEIMSGQSSKVKAVQFVMERYHLKQEEIIAIGDNFNDEEMIAFAGMGVAMGNAPAEVKALAKYTTDTNNQDGVHKALTALFELS
jgi:Cof subfamily protein (haloacid dehalogenase superfamily)